MKFGQLIEFNMKNIFLKNHAKNVVGKLYTIITPWHVITL